MSSTSVSSSGWRAAVEQGVRSESRLLAKAGGFWALVGLLMMPLVLLVEGGLLDKLGLMAFFAILTVIPGAWLLRKGLRPVQRAPAVQLLTSRRSELRHVYPRYVSYNNGPTVGRLHVVDSGGKDHRVQLPATQLKAVCQQLRQEGITVTDG